MKKLLSEYNQIQVRFVQIILVFLVATQLTCSTSSFAWELFSREEIAKTSPFLGPWIATDGSSTVEFYPDGTFRRKTRFLTQWFSSDFMIRSYKTVGKNQVELESFNPLGPLIQLVYIDMISEKASLLGNDEMVLVQSLFGKVQKKVRFHRKIK